MSFLFRRPDSKYWWIKYKHPETGEFLRKSLKTTDKALAIAYLSRYRKYEKSSKNEPVEITLKDLGEQWHAIGAITGSKRQADNNLRNLEQFFEFTEIVNVEHITKSSIQAWIVNLVSNGIAPKTAKNKLSSITSFCNFLVDKDLMLKVPRIKAPKVKRLPPRFLTPEQIDKTLEIAKGNALLYRGVIIALKTGIRLDEMRKLDWENFHWDQNLVVIPETKSNRPRSIPLHPDLIAELKPVAKKRGPVFPSPIKNGQSGKYYDKWWFGQLIKPIQKAIPEAFTAGMSTRATGRAWHLFRHTFASRAVQAGIDIFKVSQWLGHSSVNTTMIYAHLTPRHDEDIGLV